MNFYDLGEWAFFELESDPKVMTNQYTNSEYTKVTRCMQQEQETLRV